MAWYKLIPILDLLCLLIELSDPTTPFVRVEFKTDRPSGSALISAAAEDGRPSRSLPSAPDFDQDVTVCHSAIVSQSFDLVIFTDVPSYTPNFSDLSDQTFHVTRKRPPIA